MSIIIQEIEKASMKKDVPEFNVGDTVKVSVKIKEGDKERLQAFEGIVLKRQRGGNRETTTVRKIVDGIGVERTFPIHSPRVDSIKVMKKGKVRRAKLYYMRARTGGSATKIEEAEQQ
jgi:large subunit ribosomal protein L19